MRGSRFRGSGFRGSGFSGSGFSGSKVQGLGPPLALKAASLIEVETVKKRMSNNEYRMSK
jgi:hypothetical protein